MQPSIQSNQIDEVKRVEKNANDPNDYTLDELRRLIRLERTNSLNQQYRAGLNKLRMGQLKMSILTELRSYINLNKSDSGKFDAKNSEFQELITKSRENYDNLSEELIQAGENPDSFENFEDLLSKVGIKEGEKKYSEEETRAILETIKMQMDQLAPLDQMNMQAVTRIESEINETYQMLIASYKATDNAITAMARAVKGAG